MRTTFDCILHYKKRKKNTSISSILCRRNTVQKLYKSLRKGSADLPQDGSIESV